MTRVRVVVKINHTMPTGDAYAKINKVKDLALIFLAHQDSIFCEKYLEQAFIYIIFHSHPFNEMFIVNCIAV